MAMAGGGPAAAGDGSALGLARVSGTAPTLATARAAQTRILTGPSMPVPMDICTIIAKNYLAAARVLAQSFHEQHPSARCHVLVIDEIEDYFDPAQEPF